MAQPTSKKAKISYELKWKEVYGREFKGIVQSDKGPSMAFSSTCNSHFSIKTRGKYDVKRHFDTQKNMTADRAAGNSSLMSAFSKKSEDHSTIDAEVVMTKFLIVNDLPIAISDDVGDLLRTMCPNNAEFKNYKCVWTKTTAFIPTLADHEKKRTLENVFESCVFSLSMDGGNDTKQKLFPILIRYSDLENERVATGYNDSKGIDIFNHVKKVVEDNKLDFKNCISFSVDNAALMVGENLLQIQSL